MATAGESAVDPEEMKRFRERVVDRSVKPGTLVEYERWIRRFERWYDGEDPSLATLEDFDTLLVSPEQTVYPWSSPRTPKQYAYSTRIVALSGIKKWVRRVYGTRIPEQPDDIALGGEEEFDPTYLSKTRVNDVVTGAGESCNCHGCKAALALSYDAILRASELTRLTRDDLVFNPDGDGETPAEVAVDAAKGSNNATLEIGEDTADLLREYLDEAGGLDRTDPLFTNTYGGEWNRKSWSSHVIKYHCKEGSHSFGRHSPILHLLEDGVDFGTVYRRARHVNPQTTIKYARHVGREVPSWATGDG